MLLTHLYCNTCCGCAWIMTAAMCNPCQSQESMFDRPVAVAVSSDGILAYIGNQESPTIVEMNTSTHESRTIQGNWDGLADLSIHRESGRLVAVTRNPPEIIEFDVGGFTVGAEARFQLPGIPARIAHSLDGQYGCISMTWERAVCLIAYSEGNMQGAFPRSLLEVGFQPKEVLSISDRHFLVADAFGGQLAVIDAVTAKVIATHNILGHHIAGLALDDSLQTVAITHQRLSGVAQTTRDDIHWGTLMQNMVSIVPQAQLMAPSANVSRTWPRNLLGDVGNGAADPSGVIASDGRVIIAISGTNKIAFRGSPKGPFQYREMSESPSRLVRAAGDKFVVISSLGDTATMLEFEENSINVLLEIGIPRKRVSAAERGEAAFFSGLLSHDGWMSCNSCHVDGHSPDLLADTKGDGSFGNPKRIPSLLNVGATGPWTWYGLEATLSGQVRKTLQATMHRDSTSHFGSHFKGDDESVSNDLVAFLVEQRLPNRSDSASDLSRAGRILFRDRGCTRCHSPETHYTSRETYDVGVLDEAGVKKFNPPSLQGLVHRKAFFHDARYKSLEELLESHPDAKIKWTADELTELESFLKNL